MSFPDLIETERLILRPYGWQDLDGHVEILSNWDVTQWLSTNVPFPFTRADGEKTIAEAIRQFADGSSIRYALTDKESGRHVGGIRVFSETPETEVGYWLHPDFWGRGLGTEILKSVIGAGFDGGIITRFVAQTATKNAGSRRILEKVGFKHAGTPPPAYARCGHNEGCSEYYRLPIADWSQDLRRKDV
ncbi:MAG: hypothetical protein COB54_04910 [Alphaproteobacteria bacterium]|nr:MAG: hypothetical protein COB54_04910 [Alphaproteobacteria bacterium]